MVKRQRTSHAVVIDVDPVFEAGGFSLRFHLPSRLSMRTQHCAQGRRGGVSCSRSEGPCTAVGQGIIYVCIYDIMIPGPGRRCNSENWRVTIVPHVCL